MNYDEPSAPIWTSSDERWPTAVVKMIRDTRRLKDVQRVAVMPDVHLASGFCVGTVLATKHLIYPSAVGSDIGCGMLAMAFNAKAKRIKPRLAKQLLELLPQLVPARRQKDRVLHLRRDRVRLSTSELDKALTTFGSKQLGTLGSGNHFLELQREEQCDQLWLMIHSGSRGLGQAISDHHVARATGRSMGRPYLDATTDQGKDYLHDLRIARAYARLNRLMMAKATVFALEELAGIEADWSSIIHTDHNHVRQESVDGERYWVHRKGAAPAFQGIASVIPGSMGTTSYHVEGRGHCDSLRSSSHGAGRKLDRTTARRTVGIRKLKQAMDSVYYNEKAVSKLRDEAPWAYKNIDAIVGQQYQQVRIIRRLMPVLNYKGT